MFTCFVLTTSIVAIGVTPPPTTTTTTNGPELAVVVDEINAMLTNYSDEDLPTKDLSQAINVKIDFYLVGVNDIDEVCSIVFPDLSYFTFPTSCSHCDVNLLVKNWLELIRVFHVRVTTLYFLELISSIEIMRTRA